jgi:transcriptional regulator with XRE-family HTH domain
LGITFQQVQKYENGTNRISASRLAHIARLLDVQVSFFFEGLPKGKLGDNNPMREVTKFLATTDGLSLVAAFTRISGRGLRRSVVALVQELAGPAK